MAEETKPRKPRAKRRNFQSLTASAITHCKASIAVAQNLKNGNITSDMTAMSALDGRIRACEEILRILEGAE